MSTLRAWPARGPMSAPLRRRDMLVASGVGMAGFLFGRPGQLRAADAATDAHPKAKSTILFFLSGGASHIDLWDMKPKAPLEYRGPFQPIATSAAGIELCEHLPLLAQQAHHLSLVRSIGASVNTNDHHAGYYYNLTGHVPDQSFLSLGNNRTPYADDWPYMGAVVAAKRPPHVDLTNAITLPQMPSKAPYTRPGQFAARLGVEHDPLYVLGNPLEPLRFQAPALALGEGMTAEHLASRQGLLQSVDDVRRQFDRSRTVHDWNLNQERAFGLLTSSLTSKAFDVSSEPAAVRERYGQTVNGMSLLLARRLVEAGVPFITVFWMEDDKWADKCQSAGGWDTHANNFGCLKENLLPEFDRAFSALIADLAERGLLDETLVLVTSEMGRTPKIGDPRSGGVYGAGRDHWTHCLTDILLGGGIKGGQVYGSSDRFAEYPADRPVTPADITKTVYHAMGINNLDARDREGRPFNLLAEGRPILELF